MEIQGDLSGVQEKEWSNEFQIAKTTGKWGRCAARCKRKKDGVSLWRVLLLLPRFYAMHCVVGSITAVLHGMSFPGFAIAFGKLFDAFLTPSPATFSDTVATICYVFIGLGAWSFIWGYVSQMLWGYVGYVVGTTLRVQVFRSIMQQEVGWFDEQPSGKITSILSDDIALVRTGLGDKVSTWISFMSQCAVGVIVALIFSWKMALVMIATTPLTAASQAIRAKVLAKASTVQQDTNSAASSLASEAIGGFKTVASFDWQDEAVRLFTQLQQVQNKETSKEVHVSGLVYGLSYLLMFWVNALVFWYGSTLVLATPANGGITQGDFLIVFMSVLMAAMGLGQAVAISPDFARSRGAAATVFKILNRRALLDPNPEGLKDVSIRGSIAFENVFFSYPARPGSIVLKDFSVMVPAGQIFAFVGHSGAGKSTIVGLIERFYDALEGTIKVDDVNIRDYNVRWLRRQVGLVSQEPTLFDTTIMENIKFGRPFDDVSDAEVEAAARMANAHDFIMKLDQGYETPVGERGTQLSGGQKQRIAIARAILKNPSILLLDEATSALDAESEALVQEALDKLMKGRTTIIIAHRLSTIRTADTICVMDKGRLIEMGSHAELLDQKGAYFNLVSHQIH